MGVGTGRIPVGNGLYRWEGQIPVWNGLYRVVRSDPVGNGLCRWEGRIPVGNELFMGEGRMEFLLVVGSVGNGCSYVYLIFYNLCVILNFVYCYFTLFYALCTFVDVCMPDIV